MARLFVSSLLTVSRHVHHGVYINSSLLKGSSTSCFARRDMKQGKYVLRPFTCPHPCFHLWPVGASNLCLIVSFSFQKSPGCSICDNFPSLRLTILLHTVAQSAYYLLTHPHHQKIRRSLACRRVTSKQVSLSDWMETEGVTSRDSLLFVYRSGRTTHQLLISLHPAVCTPSIYASVNSKHDTHLCPSFIIIRKHGWG